MWQLVNRTPFAVGQSWTRNLEGAETWIVVVKGTFDILEDGATRVSDLQPPPIYAPVYRGEPGRSSILSEHDFPLSKTTTDVALNGTAYAPGGVPAKSIEVGLRVGSVVKTLRVTGDRTWNVGGTILSSPKAFVTMPLAYERAFGGVDSVSASPSADWYWPNPVGTGFATTDRAAANTRPPNIEYPGDQVRSWKSRPRPAGFGFIGSHWEERAKFAGTYDASWSLERQPLLPSDFDPSYFQTVPKDQQSPSFLVGGEEVSLTNLTASGHLRFRLPRVDFRLETRFVDDTRYAHDPVLLHTVILEPDFPRVSLVWHSAMECHAMVYKLNYTRIEMPVPPSEDEDSDEPIGSLLDL